MWQETFSTIHILLLHNKQYKIESNSVLQDMSYKIKLKTNWLPYLYVSHHVIFLLVFFQYFSMRQLKTNYCHWIRSKNFCKLDQTILQYNCSKRHSEYFWSYKAVVSRPPGTRNYLLHCRFKICGAFLKMIMIKSHRKKNVLNKFFNFIIYLLITSFVHIIDYYLIQCHTKRYYCIVELIWALRFFKVRFVKRS